MVILFTQWKFFLRNGSFTVLESKNSFYAMTKLQILTTFILRNESRSHTYDVSNLNLSCITSYVLWSRQKYKEISASIHVYYPNSFCAMRTRIPRLSQEVIAFDKNDSSCSFQIKVYSFKESVISFMINFLV